MHPQPESTTPSDFPKGPEFGTASGVQIKLVVRQPKDVNEERVLRVSKLTGAPIGLVGTFANLLAPRNAALFTADSARATFKRG